MSQMNPLIRSQQSQSILNPNKPVSISTHFAFSPVNMPKVGCHYHKSETITYYDKESNMPLCQQCIPIHQNELQQAGKRSNIIPLEAALIEAYSKISNQANDIVHNMSRLQELQDYITGYKIEDKASLLTNPLHLIESARQQVHSIVDNYFNTLTTFIRSRVPDLVNKIPDTPKLTQELRLRWQQIIKDLELLNSEQCLQQLIHFYNGDVTDENEQVLDQSDKAAQDIELSTRDLPYGLDIPQLHIDPLYLSQFLAALERYAYFYESNQPYQSLQNRDFNHYKPKKQRRDLTAKIQELLELNQKALQQPPILNQYQQQQFPIYPQQYTQFQQPQFLNQPILNPQQVQSHPLQFAKYPSNQPYQEYEPRIK